MKYLILISTMFMILSCSKKNNFEGTVWGIEDRVGNAELIFYNSELIGHANWYNDPQSDTVTYTINNGIIYTYMFGDSLKLKLNGDKLETIADYPMVFTRKK